MAVPAERVVGRHDVGPVGPDEEHEPADGLVHVRLPEAPRVAVSGAAHHVRVLVAEVLPLGHAEVAHRPLELARPDLAEAPVVVGRVHLGHDDLAHLPARARDEDHAPARLDAERHRAAGPDRLVVGVRVHRHQGGDVVGSRLGRGGGLVAHRSIVSPTRRSSRHRTRASRVPLSPMAHDHGAHDHAHGDEPPVMPADGPTPATAALEQAGVAFTVVRTQIAHDAEESAHLQGIELGALLRSILVRRAADDYVFVLVPGGRRFDWPKLRAHLGTNRLSLPDADEAKQVTGLRAGRDHAVRRAHGVAGDRGRVDRGARRRRDRRRRTRGQRAPGARRPGGGDGRGRGRHQRARAATGLSRATGHEVGRVRPRRRRGRTARASPRRRGRRRCRTARAGRRMRRSR